MKEHYINIGKFMYCCVENAVASGNNELVEYLLDVYFDGSNRSTESTKYIESTESTESIECYRNLLSKKNIAHKLVEKCTEIILCIECPTYEMSIVQELHDKIVASRIDKENLDEITNILEKLYRKLSSILSKRYYLKTYKKASLGFLKKCIL